MNHKNLTLIILAAACWGIGTVMSKAVLTYVPPLTLLVVQLLVSSLFLWTAVFLQRNPISINRQMAWLGVAGVLNPGMAYTFGLLGLTLTTVSDSALIWAAEPALILLLAWLMLRERLSWPVIALSLAAIAGALLVVGLNSGGEKGGTLLGNLLVLVAVSCCALYTILTRRAVDAVQPLLLAAVQQGAALVWALAIWPAGLQRGELAQLANLDATIWLWAVLSGVVYYGLAFWFYITGLKATSASLAGLLLNLIPVFGLGGAYLFLGERLAPTQLLGTAVILLAVAGASQLQGRESPAAVPAPAPGPLG